jgi:hypothetical protein
MKTSIITCPSHFGGTAELKTLPYDSWQITNFQIQFTVLTGL